jgi:hypothetical protein
MRGTFKMPVHSTISVEMLSLIHLTILGICSDGGSRQEECELQQAMGRLAAVY